MSRTPRDLETRDSEKRSKHDSWRPASVLPTPLASPGVRFRWIRSSTLGQSDIKNVSARTREGWVPAKREDHPELEILADLDSRWKDGVEVGGLLLCKTAEENVDARNDYYGLRAQEQLKSVDSHYLRDNDPRMPKLRPERQTRTSFGSGE